MPIKDVNVLNHLLSLRDAADARVDEIDRLRQAARDGEKERGPLLQRRDNLNNVITDYVLRDADPPRALLDGLLVEAPVVGSDGPAVAEDAVGSVAGDGDAVPLVPAEQPNEVAEPLVEESNVPEAERSGPTR